MSLSRGLPGAVLLGIALCWAAVPALADEVQRFGVRVMVSHVSNRPGSIDGRVAQLAKRLGREGFPVQSVRMIQERRLSLALNEVGSLELPTGRVLKVKPRKLSERGLLMSVEIVGTLRTSLQVLDGHQVVIGAQNYEDGKLLIIIEPDY